MIGNIFSELAVITHSIIDNLAEILALAHWFSDLVFLLTLFQLMSGHGIIEGYVLWLVSSLTSSIVCGALAELLASIIPTPLRWAKPLIEQIVEIIGI